MRWRFLAVILVLGLCLAAVASSGIMLIDSAPVEVGHEFEPTMHVPVRVDADGNRVSDGLDAGIAARLHNGTSGELASVVVMLSSEPDSGDAAAFEGWDGVVTSDLWSHALYGFSGRIPFGRIVAYVNSHSNVLLVEEEAECHATVAYAAKQIGARPYVWSTLGLRGDENSSLAVLDTGIDGSHVDLAPGYGSGDFSKKIVGWNDQIGSLASPYDDNGHGSHCSGLAAGDGFFSVDSSGYATATWGANLERITSAGTYFLSGMMVNKTGSVRVSVRWANTGKGALSSLLLYNGSKSLSTGSWSQLASVSTPNQNTWYSFTYDVVSTPSGGYDMYHVLGSLTAGKPGGTENLYIMFNFSWPYVPPTDGFSAWTGLAPDSKLVGVKVLDSTGSGTSPQLISGLDWVVANRVAYHITVVSMSLGFSSEVSSVDSAIVNLVNSGVSTIVAAGNTGSGANNIYTPGSVDEVLTVAAMNQFDNVASYSSQGGTSRYTGNTVKPDVTAPGGSSYAVPLFSVDSNHNDAEGRWPEVVANDSAPMQGTSMATPVVAGAAQTLVEALGGFSGWNWTRGQALLPKMLLLMTATETFPKTREGGTSPTLERGGKDAQEGYGRINVDAAADAVLKTYLTGTTVADSLGSAPSLSDISVVGQKLAWARNMQLFSGISYNFSLSVPAGADYDLYLYNATGNSYGEPVILTKSTNATAGAKESVLYTPSLSGEYFVVVKRAREDTSGGQFTLTSTPYSLTVNTVGSGSVTKSPDQALYASGTIVTLTAVPLAGWSFSGWSGDLSGTANPETITIDGNKAVTATFTKQQDPVVRYIDVWSYPDNNWVIQGGTVIQGHTARIYAGIANPVAPVSISHGPSGGSLTTETASYESTWDYYYVDWAIPYSATLSAYDVKVESGITSTTANGRFQVGAAAPIVNYIDVWSYPDNNWVPQGGVVTVDHTARIYAGVSNPVEPVSISYRLQGGSWATVTASYESTWDYYYVDWLIPYGADLGLYDVKVESGGTSDTVGGRFQVEASVPVVNYIDVWSYPDNNWVPQGGTVTEGHTARIYAGIANPVTPVSISYRLQGGPWTTVTALYESTWDYYYIDWAIPYGADLGFYDVQVESGVTSVMASGRFQVGV